MNNKKLLILFANDQQKLVITKYDSWSMWGYCTLCGVIGNKMGVLANKELRNCQDNDLRNDLDIS